VAAVAAAAVVAPVLVAAAGVELTTETRNRIQMRYMTLLGWLAALAIGASVMAQSVIVRLPSGKTFRGELNDAVTVTYDNRGIETVFTGALIRDGDLYIVVRGMTATGDVQEKMLFKSELIAVVSASLEDAAEIPEAVQDTDATESEDESGTVASENTRGVFVLPLSGMVGTKFRAAEIDTIIEQADAIGPGQTIILLIDSGGGVVTEWELIYESIMSAKGRHRFIAWIKKAISAAAATAIVCEEIYFQTGGVLGAITMHSGGNPVPDQILYKWIEKLQEVVEEGSRSPLLVGPMTMNRFQLSYDKDSETGEVTFYPDMRGEFDLSNQNENLVFNLTNAIHSGFADGKADTVEELAVLLDMDVWHEFGTGREVAEDWVTLCDKAAHDIPLLWQRRGYKNAGSGQAARLGTMININKELIRWWDRCPNVCRYEGGIPPKEYLLQEIEQWKRALRNGR
jgi:hypothetical protein